MCACVYVCVCVRVCVNVRACVFARVCVGTKIEHDVQEERRAELCVFIRPPSPGRVEGETPQGARGCVEKLERVAQIKRCSLGSTL